MKVRITKKGLPKHQVGTEVQLNQQVGGIPFTPAQPFTPSAAWAPLTEAFPVSSFNKQPMYVPQQKTELTKENPTIVPIKKFSKNEWMPAEQDRLSYGMNKGMAAAQNFMNQKPVKNTTQGAFDVMKVIGAASPFLEMMNSNRKGKAAERAFRETQLVQGPVSYSNNRGDYEVNTGILDPYNVGAKSKGQLANAYYTPAMEEGGQTNNTMRIRIVKAPTMEYGGQMGYGLDLGGRRVYTDMPESMGESVSDTIGPVPEEMANIEAERGETMLSDVDGDGMMEHMKIGGKRHSEGGTPLAANSGDFIFSDTRKMRIKDPEVLKAFGSSKKGGATPAQLAKKFDINSYKAIIDDPNSDGISKRTAEMMIKNNQEKLARLAMVQEAMKGFPDGIPSVAESVMPEAKYGGYFQKGGQKNNTLANSYPWLKPWVKSNTVKGRTSPTGKTTTYNENADNLYQNIGEWEKIAGRKFNSLEDLQGFAYSTLEQSDPSIVGKMWGDWGKTANSGDQDVQNFADGIMGGRTADVLAMRPKQEQSAPGTKWKCTADGPVAVRGDGPFVNQQVGLFNSYEEALAVCSGASQQEKEPDAVNLNQNTFTGNKQGPFGFMTPDVVNMFANAAVPPDVTYGYRPQMSFEPGNYTLEDWRSKAQQRQQTFNNAANTMSTYGSTAGQAANLSFLAGQTAEGVTADIAGVDSRNVDRINIATSTEQQRKDQTNLFNTAQKQELWKDNAIARQQFQNAKRNYIRDLAGSYSNAWNNRMNLGLVNTTNPMFNIDPKTGRSFFKSGYGPQHLGRMGSSGSATGGAGLSGYDNVNNIKRELMSKGLSEANAEREALSIVKGGVSNYTDTDMDGFPNRVSTMRRGAPANYLSQIAEMYRNNMQEMGGMVYPF